jgi:hypothetical protein
MSMRHDADVGMEQARTDGPALIHPMLIAGYKFLLFILLGCLQTELIGGYPKLRFGVTSTSG